MPMTPQERQLVDELFDKLASLETAPRDPDAARAIADGQRRAPNAIYALVQTVLIQDEALKRADERIQQLESDQAQPQQGGFLDSMRDTLFGGGNRGSVPSVRPGEAAARGPMWNSGQVLGQGNPGQGNGGGYGYGNGAQGGPAPAQAGGGGGSFLGTAAAAAAGVIGGSLLMNSMRGMFGGGQHGFGDQAGLGDKGSAGSGSPWGGNSNASGDLAREAGLNDIGKSSVGGSDSQSRQGFFDQASNESGYDNDDDDDDFDSDDFDSGDSDYA